MPESADGARDALDAEWERLETCALCRTSVEVDDGTAVRLVLARDFDEYADGDRWPEHNIANWAERAAWSFCSLEHATEWMHTADISPEVWITPAHSEGSDAADIGCCLGLAAAALIVVALLVLGVVQAWQLLP